MIEREREIKTVERERERDVRVEDESYLRTGHETAAFGQSRHVFLIRGHGRLTLLISSICIS